MSKSICVLKTVGNLWAWGLLTIAYFVEGFYISYGVADLLEFKGCPITGLILGLAICYVFILLFVYAIENKDYSNKYEEWLYDIEPYLIMLALILFCIFMISTILSIFGTVLPLMPLWIQISICVGLLVGFSLAYALDECL